MLVSNAVFNNYLRADGWVVESKFTAKKETETEVITLHQEVDGSVSYKAYVLGAIYCEGFVMVGYDLTRENVASLNLMGFYPHVKNSRE